MKDISYILLRFSVVPPYYILPNLNKPFSSYLYGYCELSHKITINRPGLFSHMTISTNFSLFVLINNVTNLDRI